jgi:flagellar hook protein FlgE
MLDSIQVAASGLNGHQKGLKTISNDVANMNTPGFKGSNSQFTDVFLQESDPSQGKNTGAGGGMQTLAPAINFSAGEIRSTGRDMDEALNGPGFFVVRDDRGRDLYTKAGRFDFNGEGKLVTVDKGYEVLGYNSSNTSALQPITIAGMRNSAFTPTTNVTFTGNLSTTISKRDTGTLDGTVENVTVYDAQGQSHTLKFEFRVKRVPNASTGVNDIIQGDWLVTVMEGTTKLGEGEVKTAASGADPTADRFILPLSALNGQPSAIAIVLGTGITAFSGGDAIQVAKDKVDGNAAGTISKTSIDANGMVVVTYTNALTANGAKLAVAEFITPEVLTRASGAYFEYTGNEPIRNVTLGDTTKLVNGSLELSNIDLTDQFSTMILIQRGFQASSQVLSTASEMIQSLYDIKSRR